MQSGYRYKKLRFVSGADSSHAKSAMQLLASIHKHEPNAPIVFYDLGLTPSQREEIGSTPNLELKTFEFSKYPAFFDIRVNGGEYAWKPVIIWNELIRNDDFICWMDAGNLLQAKQNYLRYQLCKIGFYSPKSWESIARITHPAMLNYLGVSQSWAKKRRNLTAGYVAFNPSHKKARQLARDWAELAQIKECIAPAGSNRTNHRQDQALLTILAFKLGVISKPSQQNFFWLWPRKNLTTHNDVD